MELNNGIVSTTGGTAPRLTWYFPYNSTIGVTPAGLTCYFLYHSTTTGGTAPRLTCYFPYHSTTGGTAPRLMELNNGIISTIGVTPAGLIC
jgi:hypothetical protein